MFVITHDEGWSGKSLEKDMKMKQADCSLDDVSAPILMRFKSYFFLETTGSISWHPSGQELVKK